MGIRVMAVKQLDALPRRPSKFTQSLPADAYTAAIGRGEPADNLCRVPRPVHRAAYSFVIPEAAPDPKLLSVSRKALDAIELNPDAVLSEDFVNVFSGNKVLEGTQPWSTCYAGHQFGMFAGQLGDGRVISLFETETSAGDHWELQLKGAGRTPYSRFGDGYAVLRSSIREYLMSEHMHALGIPTTRALALIGTSRPVYREDGPPGVKQPERGAIVVRMAPSWLRFGSFEIFYSRGDMANVQKLADYAIDNVVTNTSNADDATSGNKYVQFFRNVAKNTARMVAEWQANVFNHGVMNTDNLSILGLTLDYGPFEISDYYDPTNICNHSDEGGKYSFKRQPTECVYSLFKLAVPLFELMGAGDKVDQLTFPRQDDAAEQSQESDTTATDSETRRAYREQGKQIAADILSKEFTEWFMEHLLTKMRAKLGLAQTQGHSNDMDDVVIPLLDWMTEYNIDYHRFFRSLSRYAITEKSDEEDAQHAVDNVLDIASLDSSRTQESKEALIPWLAIYRHRLLSEGEVDNQKRKMEMDRVNPRFVLRNWILQEVIDAFEHRPEQEATDLLQKCLEASVDPYRETYADDRVERWISTLVPSSSVHLKCSCSS